ARGGAPRVLPPSSGGGVHGPRRAGRPLLSRRRGGPPLARGARIRPWMLRRRLPEAVQALVEVAGVDPPLDHAVDDRVVDEGGAHRPGVPLDRLEDLALDEVGDPGEARQGPVRPGQALALALADVV